MFFLSPSYIYINIYCVDLNSILQMSSVVHMAFYSRSLVPLNLLSAANAGNVPLIHSCLPRFAHADNAPIKLVNIGVTKIHLAQMLDLLVKF